MFRFLKMLLIRSGRMRGEVIYKGYYYLTI